ncbi:hypothetical protein ACFOGI_05055 [Virgibacillus xinjiangensis]|uniref:Uncharacterized protein n=1 Tax=Virgibacillus xinjiangensis TaxID=393090 RepID=A0ABV7CTG0_9BACI
MRLFYVVEISRERGNRQYAREISRRAGISAGERVYRQEGGYIGIMLGESAGERGYRQQSMDISSTLGKSAGERGYRQDSSGNRQEGGGIGRRAKISAAHRLSPYNCVKV